MLVTTITNSSAHIHRVDKAVRAGLLVLVDLIDNQEDHTHQESQGTDHQQGHLERKHNSKHF